MASEVEYVSYIYWLSINLSIDWVIDLYNRHIAKERTGHFLEPEDSGDFKMPLSRVYTP